MESGCLILLGNPMLSSGSLEQDAIAVFDAIYKGWQPRKTGPQSYLLSKGVLAEGPALRDGRGVDGQAQPRRRELRRLRRRRRPGGRERQSIRRHPGASQRPPGARQLLEYEGWRRFFNSLTLKNVPVASPADDGARRIVGRWTSVEGGAVGDYTFAANGRYSFGGAISNTTQAQEPTYDLQGNSSYSVSGSRLTMVRGRGQAEQVAIRFVEVNQGGTGWTERLCMREGRRDGNGERGVLQAAGSLAASPRQAERVDPFVQRETRADRRDDSRLPGQLQPVSKPEYCLDTRAMGTQEVLDRERSQLRGGPVELFVGRGKQVQAAHNGRHRR